MKRKIFFQMLAVTVTAVLLMFAFAVAAVALGEKQAMRNRLAKETEFAVALVSSKEDFSKFDPYATDDAFRVTIIDLDGNVLYESDTEATLDNHLARPEIQSALAGTPRIVERRSDTLGSTMTYYALRTTLSDGTEIVLRLALRNSQITAYLNVGLPLLMLALVLAIVAAVITANVFARKLSAKVEEVATSLRSLNAGTYEPLRTDESEPELYSVLNEINVVNENTHKNILTTAQERTKLNTVLDHVAQGIVAIDCDGRIAFVNKSALTLFGGTEACLGRSLARLVDDPALCDGILAHTEQGQVLDTAYGGRELNVMICPIADESLSQSLTAIVIVTDVTAEREMQRQKSDFFANASHELKTPVTVMQGMSELLRAKTLDAQSAKQVERIHTECERLSALIADMLRLSKLERGEQATEQAVELDLGAVCHEAIAELSGVLAQKQVTATVSGTGRILADPRHAYELVINLCSNAVHYNKPDGTVGVSVTERDGSVVLTVTDSGIGIAPEHIPRLCERFYRVDKSRSKKTGGTGLGLAIVKHVCSLYGATLSIESTVGVGTTVTVTFPAAT